MKMFSTFRVSILLCFSVVTFLKVAGAQPGLIRSDIVADPLPLPFNHASTLIETREGLLVAWAAGLQERATDVSIWVSRYEHNQWSRPVEVADGVQPRAFRRYPCWNPVLFQPKDGPLTLYYKIGGSPESWWGMMMTSTNNGRSWSKPQPMPRGAIGPVRNKPVQLSNGTILAGASTESAGWRVHMERQVTPREGWQVLPPISGALEFGAIQPTVLPYRNGRIQILCRTKYGRVVESWSENNGSSWSKLKLTPLPNPNSSVDGVMLIEGSALIVYNHSATDKNSLHVAMSQDGSRWQAAMVIANEPGQELSYPAVIQTSDGLVHVTYTWNRRQIRHVVIDPWQCKTREMQDGMWPW